MRLFIHGDSSLVFFPKDLIEDFIKEFFPNTDTILHTGEFPVISELASEKSFKEIVFRKEKGSFPSKHEPQLILERNLRILSSCDAVLIIWNTKNRASIKSILSNCRMNNKPHKVYSISQGSFSYHEQQ